MFEQVKNVMANKETTCGPKRTLPTISFSLIPHDVGILMTFQQNSNSYRSPYGTDSNPVSYLRAILFGYFLSKRVRNSSGCQKSACKLLNNLLILTFCFIAGITATIPSELPSPCQGRYHILLFKELSHKSLHLKWYSNLLRTFLTATDRCFSFGSSSFHFFEINGV